MSLSEEDKELIEDYLDENLAAEKRALFEEKRLNNKDFSDHYSLQKKIIESIKESERNNLKKELTLMYDEVKSQKKQQALDYSVSLKPKHYWYAAASIILLISSVLSVREFLKPSSEDLYTAYFEPLTFSSTVRGEEVEGIELGMKLYEQQNYQEAIPFLKSNIDSYSKITIEHLYLSNAYMMEGMLAEAEETLIHCLSSDDRVLKQTTEWYLSLVYLKRNDEQKAIDLLSKIQDKQQLKSASSKEILEKLD